MKRLFIICLSVWFCAYTPARSQDADGFIRVQQSGYLSQLFPYPVPDFFNAPLYLAVSDWLGVPYRYAGTSIRGIDCSAFVRKVLGKAYGIHLMGNSAGLFQTTSRVPRRKLEQGDLVFFRTGRKRISHVGIYLGDNKFAHSSRSRGVIVSDLDTPYYRHRYAGAGRLPDIKPEPAFRVAEND
jgi:lipoprotein Spr